VRPTTKGNAMDPKKEMNATPNAEEVKQKYSSDEDEQDAQILAELEAEEKAAKKETSDEILDDEKDEKEDKSEDKKADEEVKTEEKEVKKDDTAAEADKSKDALGKDTVQNKDTTPIEKGVSAKLDVAQYAKDNEMSLEDAQAEIESIEKLQAKYGNDTNQLAKAALYALRMQSKTQQELKEIKQASAKEQFDLDNENHVVWGGKKYTKDQVIADYQKNFPAKFERLQGDDQAVFEDAKEMLRTKYQFAMKNQAESLKSKANEKRILALKDIPDADIKYLDRIKEIIKHTDDATILDDRYDLEATLCMARGEKLHEEVKAAEERGYKRGLEEAKILGEKASVPDGKATTKASESKAATSLTEEQKRDAEDMYEDDNIPLSKKYEYYQDYLKNEARFKKAS